MLDYAANGTAYWPADELRRHFEAGGTDPAGRLRNELGRDDPEQFWGTVETNLREGRLRLLFVADQIPPELQRLIEFLNDQMTRTEVLGVEVRQFRGDGLRVLDANVIGATAQAADVKDTAQTSAFEEVWRR